MGNVKESLEGQQGCGAVRVRESGRKQSQIGSWMQFPTKPWRPG